VTCERADSAGERLRERALVPHETSEYGWASISVGITHFRDASSTALEELFSAADRALYDAKRLGRNRCIRGIDVDAIVVLGAEAQAGN